MTMSAGTGVRHSESNPSQSEPVHFLQIWSVNVNGQPLAAGDALKAEGLSEIVFEQGDKAEVLLFDLA